MTLSGVGGPEEEAFYRLAEEGVVAYDADKVNWRSYKVGWWLCLCVCVTGSTGLLPVLLGTKNKSARVGVVAVVVGGA